MKATTITRFHIMSESLTTRTKLTISKRKLILFVLLPGLFLSDILYGLLTQSGYQGAITPGVFVRGGVFVCGIVASIRYRLIIGVKLVAFCWALLAISIIGPLIGQGAGGQVATILKDLNSVAKIMYGPFTLILMMSIQQRYRVTAESFMRYVEYSAYLIGASLFFMNFLGVGKLTYGTYAYGSTGLFHAQNEISLSCGIALVPAVYRNLTKPSLPSVVLLTMAVLGIAGLGTITSMIVIAFVPVAVVVVIYWAPVKTDDIKMRRNWLTAGVAVVMIILMSWASIVIHDYMEAHSYQVHKIDKIASGDLIRTELYQAGAQYLTTRDFAINIFGEGITRYQEGVFRVWGGVNHGEIRSVEMDWVDLFGAHGIVFLILLYGLYLFLLLFAIRGLIVRRGCYDGLAAIMLFIYLGHSILAGHALVSPIVSTIVAVPCALLAHEWNLRKGFMTNRHDPVRLK